MSPEHQEKNRGFSTGRVLLFSLMAGSALYWLALVNQGSETQQPGSTLTTSPIAPNWSQTNIAVRNFTPSPQPGVFEYRPGSPSITPRIAERVPTLDPNNPIATPRPRSLLTQPSPLPTIKINSGN